MVVVGVGVERMESADVHVVTEAGLKSFKARNKVNSLHLHTAKQFSRAQIKLSHYMYE